MRIGGEAPRRRTHSRNRYQNHGLLRVTATSDRHRMATMFCSSASESLSFVSPHAARNTTPAGTSPVVTRRHMAISNLRARATIIVLRFLPAPSVRVRYHWANALSEAAQAIQLHMVYAPEPPFDSGTPEMAPAAILEQARQSVRAITARRDELALRVAAKLGIAIPAA